MHIADFVTMIVKTLGIFNRRLGFRLKNGDHILPIHLLPIVSEQF